MIKKQWLISCPLAVLLSLGAIPNSAANTPLVQTKDCPNCQAQNDNPPTDQNYDYNNNDNNDVDYDASQDYGQEQSDNAGNAQPGNSQNQMDNNINSDNGDED